MRGQSGQLEEFQPLTPDASVSSANSMIFTVRPIMLRYVLTGALALSAVVSVSHQSAHPMACRPRLAAITLAQSSIPGGASDRARVTISCAAGQSVSVKLRGFTGVEVPAAVSIAPGKTSATATVRSVVRKVTERGSIGARLGTVRRSAALTVTKTPRACNSPALTGMSLVKLAYVGDHPVARISLTCAPRTRVVLGLSSTNANVRVPATVTVGRYYDYARVILSPKAYEPGQYSATIKVRHAGKSFSRSITIDPGLSLVEIPAVSDSPNDVVLDVLFTGVIPAAGETVRLASSSAAVAVPAIYTFPAPSVGGQVTGITVQEVAKNTKVTLSATLGSVKMTASTVLLPPFNSNDSAKIFNTNGPDPIYGLSGLTFNVSSGSPDLSVSNPQFIDAGSTADYFTVDTTLVTAPVHTTLSATIDGVPASVNVTIEPPMSAFANVPSTVTSDQSFPVTLQMFGPVDTPTVVDLNSSGLLGVPASVTVPAGSDSVTFTVTAPTVTSAQQDFIYAMIVTNSEVEDSLQSS